MSLRTLAVALSVASLGLVFAVPSSRADSIRSYQPMRDVSTGAFEPLRFSAEPVSLSEFRWEEDVFEAREERGPEFGNRGRDDRFRFIPVGEHVAHIRQARESAPTTVPEPDSLLLASLGLAGLALLGTSIRLRPPSQPGV